MSKTKWIISAALLALAHRPSPWLDAGKRGERAPSTLSILAAPI